MQEALSGSMEMQLLIAQWLQQGREESIAVRRSWIMSLLK